MPELIEEGFWTAQIQAVRNLEKSLAKDCPRSLIQMATGSGKKFTDEHRQWLTMIRDHIAANLSIGTDDFDYAPFSQKGRLGKIYQLFGNELNTIIEQLNETLAA